MSEDQSNKDEPRKVLDESEKYSGVVPFDLALTPSVIICAAAGAVLGLVLAMWGTSEIPIIVAAVICFSVLSGIFGMFVPWYKK